MRHPPRPGHAHPLSVWINICFNSGGMGDHLCRMISVLALARTFPHVYVDLYVPTYLIELVTYWVAPYSERIFVKDFFKDWAHSAKRMTYYFNDGNPTSFGTHLVDQGYLVLLDQVPPNASDRNYLPIEGQPTTALPERYIVLTPGYTAPNRSLPGVTWNAIAAHVKALGYEPVWLGKADVEANLKGHFDTSINYSVGLDFRNATTLMEAARIMGQAAMVVGLDNGLLHLAASTDVPIVAGYSSVDPRIRLPIRHGQLGWNVWPLIPEGCRGCESFVRFDFEHDFKYCYYEPQSTPSADYQCIKSLSPDRWCSAINRILNKEVYDIKQLDLSY